MKTAVGYRYERQRRKSPHLVYWWDPPDEHGKQRKRTRTFEARKDARSFAADKQTAIDRGELPMIREDHTLTELIREFTSSRLSRMSYSGQQGYRLTLGQLEAYLGGGTLVDHIHVRKAEAFVATRRKINSGAALASWTINKRISYCRALFAAAIEWGWIDSNPFRAVAGSRTSPLVVRGKSRPWHHITPAEFERFMAHVRRPEQRAMYWLMYGCGLRWGEAVNVRLDVLDLAGGTVRVEDRAGTADIPPFTVKGAIGETSKARTVDVPNAAMDDIAAAARLALRSGGFLCLTAKRFALVRDNWRRCRAGEFRYGPERWQNSDTGGLMRFALSTAVKRSGLKTSAPLTFTAFRKSFAQNHADAGTPPKTLMELMGHSDMLMTTTYYQRATDANRAAAAATMNRLLATKHAGKADTA